MRPRINKPRSRYATVVFGLILVLLLLHLLVTYFDLYRPSGTVTFWTVWFDLDREKNIPAAISSLLLLGCGFYALKQSRLKTELSDKVFWGGATGLFAYLALDEFMIIHEQVAEPLRKILNITNGSPFFHAWIIPAGALVIVGVIVLYILRALNIRRLLAERRFMLYLILWASGVILLEIVGTKTYQNLNAYRLLMIPAEEIFEMTAAGAMLVYLHAKSYSHGLHSD